MTKIKNNSGNLSKESVTDRTAAREKLSHEASFGNKLIMGLN